MESEAQKINLVSPSERWPLVCGKSVLYYRRLSLGALASLEKQHTVLAPARRPGETPRAVIRPQVLEAAICAQALVGWRNVGNQYGEEVPFSPEAALRLPASLRKRLVAQAMQINPAVEEKSK